MSDAIPPLFDTHAHILAADRDSYPPAAAHRDMVVEPFTIADLIAGMDAENVERACVVQRYFFYRNDNSYALDSSRLHPDRLTPVIMLDGTDPETPGQLRAIAAEHRLGGIRFTRPEFFIDDTSWMNSPNVMRIWETAAELGLPVAFIMYEPHMAYNLPALKLIAERFPDLPIVIDHLGIRQGALPSVREARSKPGYTPYVHAPDFGVTPALREMLECPNVSYKFTGINLECLAADAVDTAEFMRFFVDEFGAERVVFGTDIGQTEGPYGRIVGGLREALRLLDDTERQQVMFDNAARIYAHAFG